MRPLASLFLFFPLCASACGPPSSCTNPSLGPLNHELFTFTEADFARPWVLLRVPCASRESVQGLARGLDGFLAVVFDDHSEGKTLFPDSYRLARSGDGVNWTSSIIDPETMDRWYEVAQGHGPIVVAGMRHAQYGAIRTSCDGRTWHVQQTATRGLRGAAFVNNRFFALGYLGALLVSDDGFTWHDRSVRTAQNNAIAFGNGRWVVAGNTEFFVSTDTVTWDASTFQCDDPATCPAVMPPGWQGGDPVVLATFSIFFARGQFYAGQFFSPDGYHWQAFADPANVPSTFHGDLFLRFTTDGGVHASRDTATWSLETTLTEDNPAGYTCAAHPCFTLDFGFEGGRAIVLVPRP